MLKAVESIQLDLVFTKYSRRKRFMHHVFKFSPPCVDIWKSGRRRDWQYRRNGGGWPGFFPVSGRLSPWNPHDFIPWRVTFYPQSPIGENSSDSCSYGAFCWQIMGKTMEKPQFCPKVFPVYPHCRKKSVPLFPHPVFPIFPHAGVLSFLLRLSACFSCPKFSIIWI